MVYILMVVTCRECGGVCLGEKVFLWKENKEGAMGVCLLVGVTGFSCQQEQSQSLYSVTREFSLNGYYNLYLSLRLMLFARYLVCSES
jgi:hypothetical protein